MKKLFILRGVPASGKSTIIKNLGLQSKTVSSDEIRIELYGISEENGKKGIVQGDGRVVFGEFFHRIEKMMADGQDVIIADATHTRSKDFKPYFELVKNYGYEIFCVTVECDLNEALSRNRQREDFRIVPDDVIEKFYNRIQSGEVPNGIKVISVDEFIKSIKST